MQRQDFNLRLGLTQETSNSFRIIRAIRQNKGALLVEAEYFQKGVEYIEEGEDVLDHDQHVKSLVSDFFCLYDALIIPGNSSNIDSGFFINTADRSSINLKRMGHRRAKLEIALVQEATKLGLPILGICGGHQIINVALGGSLGNVSCVQRLAVNDEIIKTSPTMLKKDVEDKKFIAYLPNTGLHTIVQGKKLCKDSFIYALEYSSHEEAIEPQNLNPIYVIAATNEKGVIQAIEMNGHPWILGTQFHPEWFEEASDPSRNIFVGFIKTCHLTKLQRKLKSQSKAKILIQAMLKELSSDRWDPKKESCRFFNIPITTEVTQLKQCLLAAKDNPNVMMQEIQTILIAMETQKSHALYGDLYQAFIHRFKDQVDKFIPPQHNNLSKNTSL